MKKVFVLVILALAFGMAQMAFVERPTQVVDNGKVIVTAKLDTRLAGATVDTFTALNCGELESKGRLGEYSVGWNRQLLVPDDGVITFTYSGLLPNSEKTCLLQVRVYEPSQVVDVDAKFSSSWGYVFDFKPE